MRRHGWELVWIGLAFWMGMLPAALLASEDQSTRYGAAPPQWTTPSADSDKHRLAHDSPAVNSVFTLAAGVRRDRLQWTIAGNRNGTHPNILSELEWPDVDSYQFQLTSRTILAERLYLRAQLGYAWINDGWVRDSDYSGDNRSGEYSRSISESDDDRLWDVLLGVGRPISIGRHFMVAPLLGVSLHRQDLRIRNGSQVLTQPGGPPLGTLEGLNSTYQAEWFGAFLGCDLRYFFIPERAGFARMEGGLGLQWHWDARFEAEADWNLRSDFAHPKSFAQHADGEGVSLDAEWVVWVTPRWAVSVSANYQKWETDPGRQRYFLANGSTAVTRLNAVEWESGSCMLGIAYEFD